MSSEFDSRRDELASALPKAGFKKTDNDPASLVFDGSPVGVAFVGLGDDCFYVEHYFTPDQGATPEEIICLMERVIKFRDAMREVGYGESAYATSRGETSCCKYEDTSVWYEGVKGIELIDDLTGECETLRRIVKETLTPLAAES